VVKPLAHGRGRTLAGNKLNTERRKTTDKSVPGLDFSCSRYPAISLQSAEVAVAKSESKSIAYEFRTKTAKSGALETNGRRERI
jgi:hypothetical protein